MMNAIKKKQINKQNKKKRYSIMKQVQGERDDFGLEDREWWELRKDFKEEALFEL